MLDFPLMLWTKLSLVERIHPQRNKFATGVKNAVQATQNSTTALLHKQPTCGNLGLGEFIIIFPSFGKGFHDFFTYM